MWNRIECRVKLGVALKNNATHLLSTQYVAGILCTVFLASHHRPACCIISILERIKLRFRGTKRLAKDHPGRNGARIFTQIFG